MFGWCTWDAFYSNVSARGAGPGLARATVCLVAHFRKLSAGAAKASWAGHVNFDFDYSMAQKTPLDACSD